MLKKFKILVSLFAVLVMALSMGTMVFATGDLTQDAVIKKVTQDSIKGGSITDTELGVTSLNLTPVNTKQYPKEGGGKTSGQNVITSSDNYPYYKIYSDEFDALSADGKNQLLSDITENSNKIYEAAQRTADDKGTPSTVDRDSLNEFWSNLQDEDGVGVTFMNTILQNTKPDFVRANEIYKPFSGIVGTILGLGAVLIMALVGIVMVMDIAYIALPPVRMIAGEDAKDKSGIGSHLVSHEAMAAVKNAEAEDKNALAYYFRKRVGMLIVLGICLLYLIQGRIYTLVGWVLNLLSGIL